MKLKGGVAFLLIIVLLSPAAWAQEPDASHPPRTSGPLVTLQQGCEDDGQPPPGTSSGQSCSWTYDLLPAESDADEDFMVHWQQIELHTTGRLCAQSIGFELSVPAGYHIVSAAPDPSRRRVRTGQALVGLAVDGRGSALVPGHIEQDVFYGAGRLKVRFAGRRFIGHWQGNHRGKVVVAFGIQIARPVGLELTSRWALSETWELGTCSPGRVTE